MTISANFPALKPSLLLDFANVERLDPRITFTRASNATYFDANGVLQTASSGVARFDHNPTTLQSLGLLIEEQRTNLWVRSDDFDNASWTKVRSTIQSNTIVAPDGTLTGDKLIASVDNSNHFVRQDVSVTSGTTYTQTIYAKTGEYNQIFMGFDTDNSAFAGGAVYFTLTGNGTAGAVLGTLTSSSITLVGNGWYRCQVSATATATTSGVFRIQMATSSSTIFVGNVFNGIYIWGAQLEAGAFPTSYIPTTVAAATRNADVATMTGTNFSSWYSQGQGTVYTEILRRNTTGFPGRIRFWDGTANNTIDLYFDAANNSSTYEIKNAGVASVQIFGGGGTLDSFIKSAATWENNNAAVCYNGLIQGSDTSTTIPATIDQIRLANSLNGYIRRVAYWGVRLDNSKLQALTT